MNFEKAQDLLKLVNQTFPGWKGFQDPQFVKSEIEYKRKAIDKAKDLLSQEKFDQLLAEQNYSEIIDLLRKIAQAGYNLLYLASPRTSDIGVLIRENLNKPAFCQHMRDFLFGVKPSPDRLDNFVAYLTSEKLPARWAFLTYYLFIYWPETEVFCKPTMTNWFVKFCGVEEGLPSQPTGEMYRKVLDCYTSLRNQIQVEYPVRDIVELHSLVWAAYESSRQQNVLSNPFDRIFEDWEEANQAFDLLEYVMRKLGIKSPDDPRFSLTLPESYASRRCLRLNFGREVSIDFERKPNTLTHVRAQLAGKYQADQRLIGFDSKRYVLNSEESYEFDWIDSDPQTLQWYKIPFQRLIQILEDANYEILDPFLNRLVRSYSSMRATPYRKYNVPEIAEAVFNRKKREQLMKQGLKTGEQPISIEPLPDAAFQPKAFDLLEGLHNTRQYKFYKENEADFKEHLEAPFQRLMHSVAEILPAPILETMETEKDVFARIYKNDYGRGGAWDFYWGAFVPKETRRTAAPQLALWMDYRMLTFSFYIGDYGVQPRERFQRNCMNYVSVLPSILEELVNDQNILLASESAVSIQPDGIVTVDPKISWSEWFATPSKTNFSVRVVLPKQEVFSTSSEDLIDEIRDAYLKFFPLILLASLDDPLPAINKFLGWEEKSEEEEINEAYPISVFADETGVQAEMIQQWVRAIRRKKQVVLYGPPGTGKTFIAERLARHLIGEGNGFYQVIQFHPEYSYEDFMQGIRPRPHPGGGLDYPMEDGRFKDFCDEAAGRGPCVLIIDEINRANLARVFGELMYLLEYRDRSIPLAGGGLFKIPPNVYLIGTMNTADRSIALVDHALRRRFAFMALQPNYDVLRHYHRRKKTGVDPFSLIEVLNALNQVIGDPNYQVGVSFFLCDSLKTDIEDIWKMEIEPYLKEIFYGQDEKFEDFLWQKVKNRIGL